MKRFEAMRGQLGGQLGIGLCVLGFLLVFLGWNGAASNDSVVEQFPYLLSGGIAGLTLVLIGVGMLIVQNQRADRVALQASLDALREALERGAGSSATPSAVAGGEGLVIAGRSSYHRPTCRLVVGRDDATVLTTAEAGARGLEPCRLCSPPSIGLEPLPAPEAPEVSDEPEVAEAEEPTPKRSRQLRAR